ncbi:MAG: flagellar biosynthesis protein FlhB [Proteobacteria bacterium]|nr:flagellar biosynthesis protein FlhB [Pseudomonadota bacterium]
MAESNSQDKNLPASQRKLSKAREEGQIPRSRDLGHFFAIAVGGGVLVALAPLAASWMQRLLAGGLRFDAAMVQRPEAMGERLVGLVGEMLLTVLPFGLLMAAVGVVGTLAIGGWTFTLKPVMPKFDKLNPVSGLANLISKDRLFDAGKGTVLALVLSAIGAYYLKNHVEAFAGLQALALPQAIAQAGRTMLGGLGLVLLALGVVALVDAPWQRFRHLQRLKMSHQEVKEEHKEAEGNQEIKGKMRARMREMTQRRMIAAIPKADLVVMNPTHYAVALKYDGGQMVAPKVVAKGADLMAMRIRDIAKDSKVPVLQAPVLARALYAHAELDREIPAALFGAVAQVLAYVYQLRAAMKGDAPAPGALPVLDVPPELDPHAAAA